ncbi:MAG: energy transducer TonB [Paracoccaceae bacterium]
MAALRAWIGRHKRYPQVAVRRRLEGQGLLRVRFAADGSVLDVDLRRSAGHAVLDAEILEMIRRASPLPPIPPELGVGRMEIVLPVRFRLR